MVRHIICLLILPAQIAQAQVNPEETIMPRPPNFISLPWHLYRHYPADFSRWNEAAVGFEGWDSVVRELDLSETCLVLMHLPETGLTPATEFGPNCPNPNELGTVEWIPRTMDVVTFRCRRFWQRPAPQACRWRMWACMVAFTWRPIWEKCVRKQVRPPPDKRRHCSMQTAGLSIREMRLICRGPKPQGATASARSSALPPELRLRATTSSPNTRGSSTGY